MHFSSFKSQDSCISCDLNEEEYLLAHFIAKSKTFFYTILTQLLNNRRTDATNENENEKYLQILTVGQTKTSNLKASSWALTNCDMFFNSLMTAVSWSPFIHSNESRPTCIRKLAGLHRKRQVQVF